MGKLPQYPAARPRYLMLIATIEMISASTTAGVRNFAALADALKIQLTVT